MKKPILAIASIMAVVFTGCSSDDDSNGNCDSCTLQGERIELCDNGDGTFTLTAAGEVDPTITEEQLLGLSPSEFVNLLCAAEDIVQ
ncbi:MAG: hypothetical protein AAFO99_03245 [Bacteroidota bacterium]